MEREELFLPLPSEGEAGALMASITTQTGTLGGGPCAPHGPGQTHPQPACAAVQPPRHYRAVGTLPGQLGAKATIGALPEAPGELSMREMGRDGLVDLGSLLGEHRPLL